MVAVIGDIHGCYFTLIELYNKIQRNYPEAEVITLGDMVDRGNNSVDVLNFVLNEKIKFTPGNHDYMFYHYFKKPDSIFARSWIFNGNEMTLASYEDQEDLIPIHIESIKNAPLFFNTQDCFISHAGISNYYGEILPENFKDDLNILHEIIYEDYKTDTGVLWTRDTLLNLGKLQVVGHTKQREITLDEDSNAIYIDTGACVGNKLSAVIVQNEEIVDTIEEKTHLNDII